MKNSSLHSLCSFTGPSYEQFRGIMRMFLHSGSPLFFYLHRAESLIQVTRSSVVYQLSSTLFFYL